MLLALFFIETQTEDPLTELGTVLGPMVVNRATGKSPIIQVPEEEMESASKMEPCGTSLRV